MRNVICIPKSEQDVFSTSYNVEFSLESMFQSNRRSRPVSAGSSSVIISTPLRRTSKDSCVKLVEKTCNLSSVEHGDVKLMAENFIGNKLVKENTSSVKMAAKNKGFAADVKPSKTIGRTIIGHNERLNNVKLSENISYNNCDIKKEIVDDEISHDQALLSSVTVVVNDMKKDDHRFGENNVAKNMESNASVENAPVKIESTDNKEGKNEITYAKVKDTIEMVFVENGKKTAVNGTIDCKDALTTKRQDPPASIKLDVQNDLSLRSSSIRHSPGAKVSASRKTRKKKSYKKSKSTNASARNAKINKQKSVVRSRKESASIDNSTTTKRVPVIHIEGSKENPISAQIINSCKLEVDDASTLVKRKARKNDHVVKKSTANYVVRNYDPGASDVSWVCIFCNLGANASGMAGEATGDLFGPYFIRTPEQINLDESEKHSGETNLFEQVKKKSRQSSSVERQCMDSSALEEQKLMEIWAHENCIIWASGVYLIGSKVVELEEAVMQALDTICAHCSNKGASIGCQGRCCKSCAHYSCALYTGWKLDTETFISTCNVHSVQHQ